MVWKLYLYTYATIEYTRAHGHGWWIGDDAFDQMECTYIIYLYILSCSYILNIIPILKVYENVNNNYIIRIYSFK